MTLTKIKMATLTRTTLAEITFPVSKETISISTDIPMQGEKWFKGIPLDTSFYIYFLKPKYRNENIGASIPREYVLEPYEKLLKRQGVAERRKGKEIENSSISQPVLKEIRKLQFIDEPKKTQALSKPRTKSSTKRFSIPTI
jgi:hypothetical protein